MICLLMIKLEHKAGPTPKIARHPLERSLMEASGARHPSADFLRRIYQIGTIGAQVVGSRSLASEANEVRHRQWLLLLKLVRQWLNARCRHRIGSVEFCIPDELFRLPRISFILDTLTSPPDDPVEHKTLVIILLARAESGSNGELVLRPQLSLKPLELGPRP
jgi:hypothetical protein